jgi:hypothetical protein
MNFTTLSASQLRRAATIKDQIESLQKEFSRLVGGQSAALLKSEATPKKRRKMSAAARAKISEAAKARWAKVKAGKK